MLSLPHARTLLVIGWLLVALIIIESLVPAGLEVGVSLSDKVRHFAAYFVLMLYFSGLYPRERHLLLALVFFLLSACLEVLQGMFTTTRHMDAVDLVANSLGIALAFVAARLGLAEWARRLDR
jgi:glycopeptide antibiotics resistance protein